MTTAVYVRMQNMFAAAKEERGAAMAEYGLLLALIALAAIAAMTLFGGKINDVFTSSNNKLTVTP